jgi:polycystin 2L1
VPHIGRIDSYSGGGYAFTFRDRQSDIIKRLDSLMKTSWLDRDTRAIFVEFATYNAQVIIKQQA